MNYNVGDKFVVELVNKELIEGDHYYIVKGISNVVTSYDLKKLERLNDSYVEDNFQPLLEDRFVSGQSYGAEDGFIRGYSEGMSEAWELAKKCFATYRDYELNEIFGNGWSLNKIMEYTPQEVKAKIEAWEEEKAKIEIGTLVVDPDSETGVVICCNGDWYTILYASGKTENYCKPELINTGKSVDIASLFNSLGEMMKNTQQK